MNLAEAEAASWWVGAAGVPPWMSPFVAMEDSITTEQVFELAVVPGLLQTRAYATAVHVGYAPDASAADVDAMVEARMKRQEVLTQRGGGLRPLRLWAVIDEAVLRRQVGGRDVMAEQLSHLCEQAERPNIEIQIHESSQGALGTTTGFYLFGGPDDAAAGAVYVELDGGGTYFGKAADVARYANRFARLCAQAASMTDSLKLMTRISKEYA